MDLFTSEAIAPKAPVIVTEKPVIEYDRFVTNDGKASFGESIYVDGKMTSTEALIAARADYNVELEDAYFASEDAEGNTQFHPIDGKFAVVRQDTKAPLGIVGERYRVLQNKDAFAMFETIFENVASIDSVGILQNGGRCFMTASLPAILSRISG